MADRERASTPSHVEGAEIRNKLASSLTDLGVSAVVGFEAGFRRVTVDLTYFTARRLIDELEARRG